MFLNPLVPLTILTLGGESPYASVQPDAETLRVRLTVVEITPASSVTMFLTEGNGSNAISPVTVAGDGNRYVTLPASSTVRNLRVVCTSGSAVIEVDSVSGDIVGGNQFVEDNVITRGIVSPFQFVHATGLATTVDFDLGFNIHLDLSASTTLTLVHPEDGERYVFWVANAGAFTLAWPGAGAIRWKGGSAPVITSGAGKLDIVCLLFNEAVGKYVGSFDQDFN